jgi:hypothetical protein
MQQLSTSGRPRGNRRVSQYIKTRRILPLDGSGLKPQPAFPRLPSDRSGFPPISQRTQNGWDTEPLWNTAKNKKGQAKACPFPTQFAMRQISRMTGMIMGRRPVVF